jgi:hypothetical protein
MKWNKNVKNYAFNQRVSRLLPIIKKKDLETLVKKVNVNLSLQV